MEHACTLVDVFGLEALSGNPLAVVHDADDLDGEEMLRLTRWLNFSETTFLLRPTVPDADYRVRIFTPERELPFAGHPTLGSCHAWLEAQDYPPEKSTVVQECGAGPVSIARSDSDLAFAAPPLIRSGPVDDATLARLARILRIEPDAIVDAQWADNGPGWIAVLLESADAVLALEPEHRSSSPVDIGAVGPYPAGGATAFELRAFFSDHLGTIGEDPVTGSLNASVAQWLLGTGRAVAPYVASQGTRLGRTGRIRVTQDAQGTVWIGGRTRTIFCGRTAF
jgi:PhzF family phenazine biosynthesis protein